MQSGIQMKTRLVLLTLALSGILSACGGGSGEVGSIPDPIINPSPNLLKKYSGTYLENRCWTVAITPDSPGQMSFQLTLSASDKPNTLNFAETTYFYESTFNSEFEPECRIEIGSATIYGEINYVGTLPSVEFTDSARPPLDADQFQGHYTNKLIIEGQVGFGFDELSDYESDIGNQILAKDGNTLYFGDDSLPDADGFPTKLNPRTYSVQQ